jgi:dTDP-3-amino-3,4,6-trideoxy-alpha-D-glucose transaminase
MTVKFLDLGRLHDLIRDELDAAYDAVLRGGAFVGGPAVAAFEADFAAAHEMPGAVGCGSGTDALTLALQALGIGAGDEVVVPAMTFVASAEAVVHAGATPVIADVDPATLLLDPAAVAAVRTPRTRAVMPVHLYGHAVPFDTIEAWRDDGLLVVEDAAQAHLARWRGRPVGSPGNVACFSFYPGKNLGALGDGGALVSTDTAVLDRARKLRDHGRTEKYVHDEIGWCSRLDTVQAAFLGVKLRHLAEWTKGRQRVADAYRSALGDLLVPWEEGAVHHLLVARIRDERRDAVRAALGAAGVETGVHFPLALSRQPATSQWSGRCPAADLAATEVLSLPMDPLLSDADVRTVVTALQQAL